MAEEIDWKEISNGPHELSDEERKIAGLLAAGKSQPEIVKILGLHRSKIWRRITKLRLRFGLPYEE